MLGESDGAGDKLIGVLKQDDELMAVRGVCLMLCADAGDRVPTLLDNATKAVLMVLGEAVPQGWTLLSAAG